jgi:hypothetical protein
MYIISENQTSLFKKLVSSLVEGIHILVQQRSRIEEYGHLIPHSDIKKHQGLDGEYKICNRTNKLANSENDLHTKEELDEWLKKAIFMVHDYA